MKDLKHTTKSEMWMQIEELQKQVARLESEKEALASGQPQADPSVEELRKKLAQVEQERDKEKAEADRITGILTDERERKSEQDMVLREAKKKIENLEFCIQYHNEQPWYKRMSKIIV